MNTKFVSFKVQLFAFYLYLKMVNRADFVTIQLMIPGKALGTCYISFERELRSELISTVCSPTELNQSFLMKRIYGCNTILL